ncbi:hypothetical protein [Methylobacterium oryzisoli]|uniref:hypothetical protein n=1 Tax=Methylobacterium oryzisoli TaxID=3385502 RepID=UPI003891E337
MFRTLAASLSLAPLLLAAPALAQPQTARSYTLTLTPEQVQVIANGLGKLTMEQALPTFATLRDQVDQQDRQKADPAPKPDPAPAAK